MYPKHHCNNYFLATSKLAFDFTMLSSNSLSFLYFPSFFIYSFFNSTSTSLFFTMSSSSFTFTSNSCAITSTLSSSSTRITFCDYVITDSSTKSSAVFNLSFVSFSLTPFPLLCDEVSSSSGKYSSSF